METQIIETSRRRTGSRMRVALKRDETRMFVGSFQLTKCITYIMRWLDGGSCDVCENAKLEESKICRRRVTTKQKQVMFEKN